MTPQIRQAVEKELPAVIALLATMDGEAPMPLDRARDIYREMGRYPSYGCYIALVDGKTVGTFTLLIVTALVHGGAREAIVDAVVVAPEWRGQGIGAAMMREAQRLAAQAGCYKLALSSNLKRDDAHRFYRSLGFRQHGVSFCVDVMPAGASMAQPSAYASFCEVPRESKDCG
jgi:GNAT superfamily N-acetyltransferase